MIAKTRILRLNGDNLDTLKLDKSQFYRIKKGQSSEDVEKTFLCPLNHAFAGSIVRIADCTIHTVQPFETYATIAGRFGIGEEELKTFNFSRLIYPSCKIYIPTQCQDVSDCFHAVSFNRI